MQKQPIKIGIILTELGGLNVKALKYLVLFQNTLQQSFEFEFLPEQDDSSFLKQLDSTEPIDREAIEQRIDDFLSNYKDWLKKNARDYELTYEPPDVFVILSTAKFKDYYFSTGGDDWLISALGHWEEHMSPPSIVEFFMAILVGVAVDKACGDIVPPGHQAIKGCVSDFAASIGDARFGVLTGFLCESCCNTIRKSRSEKQVEDAKLLLRKEWLGDSTHPTVVATTAKKLGYNLFHTKGVKPTFWERMSVTIQEKAIENLLRLIGAVVLAGILLWLGFRVA